MKVGRKGRDWCPVLSGPMGLSTGENDAVWTWEAGEKQTLTIRETTLGRQMPMTFGFKNQRGQVSCVPRINGIAYLEL